MTPSRRTPQVVRGLLPVAPWLALLGSAPEAVVLAPPLARPVDTAPCG